MLNIIWQYNKEKSDIEIKELERKLIELTDEKQFVYAEKEKQKILSNFVLKKEMKANLEDAHNSLLDMKNKEIEATKKLSILQNIQLCIELEHQSNRIDSLLSENDVLQADIGKLSREVDTYKFIEESFTNKAATNQREVLKLTNVQAELTQQYEKVKADIKEMKKGHLKRNAIIRKRSSRY